MKNRTSRKQRPDGFVLLFEKAITLTFTDGMCSNMCGRPFPLQRQLRLGARLRGPTPGQGRSTGADNKADAKGTHAADWV